MTVGSLLNQEIRGATEMVNSARRSIREYVEKEAAGHGADGVLFHHGFQTEWSSTRHLVEVGVVADAIAQWRNRRIPVAPVLPLSG
jgi:hypothetical protein